MQSMPMSGIRLGEESDSMLSEFLKEQKLKNKKIKKNKKIGDCWNADLKYFLIFIFGFLDIIVKKIKKRKVVVQYWIQTYHKLMVD